MIIVTIILVSGLCLAAVAPAFEAPRLRGFRRLFSLFARRPVLPYAPPKTTSESGWQFVYSDDLNSLREWLSKDETGLPFGEDEELSLGSHLLVELLDCDPASLKEENIVGMAMHRAAVESKASIVAHSFHEFQPYGVSGAVIIQESHYTIHTWPEHGYAAVDLFYCGGTVHVHRALDVLVERFQPKRMKFLVVRRGVESEVRQKLRVSKG